MLLYFCIKVTPIISIGIEQSLKFPIYGIGGAKVEAFILSDMRSYFNGCSLLGGLLGLGNALIPDELPIMPTPRLIFIYHGSIVNAKILIGFKYLVDNNSMSILSMHHIHINSNLIPPNSS